MKFYSTKHQNGSALVIALIVAAVVIVGGGIAYVVTDGFGRNKNKDTNSSQTSNQTSSKVGTTASTAAAIKNMFIAANAGKYAVKCTFDDGTNTGTIYYAGDSKMRFDTKTDQGLGHVLRLGTTVYTWTDSQNAGTKLTISNTSSTAAQQYSADKYTEDVPGYSLKCENAGSLNASVFTVPTGVNFTDISQYTNMAP